MDISFLNIEETLKIFRYKPKTQEQLDEENQHNKYIDIVKYIDENGTELLVGTPKRIKHIG